MPAARLVPHWAVAKAIAATRGRGSRLRRRAQNTQNEVAMKRCGMLVLGLLVAVLVMPCLVRDTLTLVQLKDQAAADAATPEGNAYLKEFYTNPWMLALDAAGEQCRDAQMRSESPEEWVLALSIGDNGYPTDSLVSPDNEGLKCMAERLKATGFIRPPHDGFAIYMHAKHVEPGTERQLSPTAPATEPTDDR
jgi:hypothetical protein